MLYRPWGLRAGPEWEASVAAADPFDSYFDDNIAAICDWLARDPFARTTPLLTHSEDARIIESADRAAGYRVVVLFRVNRAAGEVELGWVQLVDLEP